MPVLIALLGVLVVAALWYWRVRAARDAAGESLEAAQDVRRAARRFGFRRQANRHPADCIEDARLAAMGVVAAMAEYDGPHTKDEIDQMVVEAQVTFGVDKREAEEIVAFGRWIATQCGTRHEAVRRLSKVVAQLAGSAAAPDLLRMAEAAAAHRGPPDERARSAIETIRRAFPVKV
ncbi:MAG TPA: hypothetical protein VFR34_08290 [Paracoccaceae bacterium]|nr:hypothetical protein [Paracoccaceae bacterium]